MAGTDPPIGSPAIPNIAVPAAETPRSPFALARPWPRAGNVIWQFYLKWWVRRRADFVVSFPKSGRTWLNAMIAAVLAQSMARPFSLDLVRMTRGWRKLPAIIFTHDDAEHDTIAHDKRFYRNRAVLFLARDPRDVVVSYYYELSRRQRTFQGDLQAFLWHPRFGLPRIVEFLNTWADCRSALPRFLSIRYEDLHRSPMESLRSVLEFLRLPGEEKDIQGAVEFTSFPRLQELEASGVLADSRMRPADPRDPESFKMRRGKIAGYRDYLTAEQIQHVNAFLRHHLARDAYHVYVHE